MENLTNIRGFLGNYLYPSRDSGKILIQRGRQEIPFYSDISGRLGEKINYFGDKFKVRTARLWTGNSLSMGRQKETTFTRIA